MVSSKASFPLGHSLTGWSFMLIQEGRKPWGLLIQNDRSTCSHPHPELPRPLPSSTG